MSKRPVCFCQHLKNYQALCGEENRTDEPNFLAAAIRVTLQQPIMFLREQNHSVKSHNRVMWVFWSQECKVAYVYFLELNFANTSQTQNKHLGFSQSCT